MKHLRRNLVNLALFATVSGSVLAAGNTKDIVLDRVIHPVVSAAPAGAAVAPASDAMAVSILLETPDGTLTPKGTDTLFRTGDRFRVKLLASRDAKVSLYNTNPLGVTDRKPVWQGEVRVGLDTISPRLSLTGNSGIDQLHIVMEPLEVPAVSGWLDNWLRAIRGGTSASKDIQLDVQNTPNATYLVNNAGLGIVSTVQIVHTTR